MENKGGGPRSRLALGIALLSLLSLPTLLFVLWNRDIPHFGILEDDGIYLIGAKSLAESSGYRVLNVPGEPFQTKYPPLYPLFLAPAWRTAHPVTTAVLLSWMSLPVCLALFHLWLRRRGFTPRAAWIVTGLFALNPYVLFFISNLGSEMFFLTFVLATDLCATRPRSAWSFLAGFLAGLGFLARTAGIALLPAAIAFYLLRREPRKAAWFTLGMLPAILGWTLWSRSHMAPGHDLVTLYYTNYLGYQFLNVGFDNIGIVVWKNVSALLESFGSYVFPQMIAGLPAKLILQPLALAMILGAIRCAGRSLYGIFGLFSAAMLLVWHFLPNQRFVLPLVPLLLAGFYSEATHFAGLVRSAFHHKDRSQRVVAYAFAGFLLAVLATGAALQIYMWVNVIPEQARSDRETQAKYASVYRWIAENTPPDASIVWENDTALFLATGRHSVAFLIPPREGYRAVEDEQDLTPFRHLTDYLRDLRLGFLMLPAVGPHRNEAVLNIVGETPELERIHEEAGGIVYRLRK